MKNNMLKTLVLLLLLTVVGSFAHAQYGFGTSNPAASAVIDMTSAHKGLLFPRVRLTSTSLAAPVVSPADYLVVFNEAAEGNVTPGLYYWKPATTTPAAPGAWVRMISSTGSVAINAATPDPSAVLDISSSTQGLLPPRMTSTQIAQIANPDAGLMVYNIEMHCLMYYANATFKCSYVNTETNQGTVVPGNAAPTFDGVTIAINNTAPGQVPEPPVYPYAGEIVTATPTGYKGNTQGPTVYQWFRYDDAAGTLNRTAIAGATTSTYNLVAADAGKYIGVSAQPTASSGTSPGLAVYSSPLTIPVWKCGMDFTMRHKSAGGVAPVDKDITYRTVAVGNSCWIIQNLGAIDTARSVNSKDVKYAGWYWQHNRSKGYEYKSPKSYPSGSAVAWATSNDPCRLLLGGHWTMPTTGQFTDALPGSHGPDYYWTGSKLKLNYSGYISITGSASGLGSKFGYAASNGLSSTSGNAYMLGVSSGVVALGTASRSNAYSARCILP